MNILVALVVILMMLPAALSAVAPQPARTHHFAGQKFPCPGETTTFSKRLVLQFQDPVYTKLSSDALKAAMIRGYNDLSFRSCDQPYFRTITEVSIIDSETPGGLYQNYQGTSFLILQVEGYCKNCTKDIPLFDLPSPIPPFINDPVSPLVNSTPPQGTSYYVASATASPQTSTAMLRRGSKRTKQEEYCICPAGSANSTFPELTIPNIIPRLNKHLLFNHTLAVTPIRISTIMEIQEISCNATVRQFTSFAYINVDLVNNKPPSRKEIQALEQSFATTYNRLSFGSCDPYFRTVVEAKLQLKIDTEVYQNRNRHLGSFTSFSWNVTNSTSANATTEEVPRRTREKANAVFTIQGECRNCPVTSAGSFTLFDDAIVGRRGVRPRRTLGKNTNTLESFFSSLDGMERLRRQLKMPDNAGTCVCPSKESVASSASSDDNDEYDDASGTANATDVASTPSGASTPITDTSSADTNGSYESRPDVPSDMSQDDFLLSFNVELKQLNEAGSVEAVESANELEEGQKVECGTNLQSFWSEVFTDLRVDLQTIQRNEVERLEQKFLETYNKVGFRTCDGHFRKIEEVELQIASVHRNGNRRVVRRLRDVVDDRSSANEANNTGYVKFNNSTNGNTTASSPGLEEARVEIVPTLFAVTGQCRDCAISNTGTFNLFDDAFRRRKLQPINLVNRFPGWLVHVPGPENQNADTCACLAGEEPTLDQGPTAEVFEKVLTDEVVQLSQEGKIDSVEGEVGSIIEGAQVNCNGEVQSFTSYVYADLGIEASQVTDGAKTRMEKVFLETYNDVSFQACDQFFRVVTNVGLVITDELGLDSTQRKLATNETASSGFANDTRAPAPSKAYFQVTGRCRNCAVSGSGSFSLFDDAFRRRSLHEKRFSRNDPSFLLSRGRRMQEALDVCLCPQGKEPGEDAPASPEEFLLEFNANIIKAQEEEEKEKEEADGDVGEEGAATGETEISTVAPAVVPVIVIQEVPKNEVDLLANYTIYSAPERITLVPTGKPTPGFTTLPTPTPTNVTSSSGLPSTSPVGKPTPNLTSVGSLPTSTPTNLANATSISTPSPTPSTKGQPTPRPTRQPTFKPTPSPTRKPSHRPTFTPSKRPTPRPTTRPTPNPTPSPTSKPSPARTSKPTPEPTLEPTPDPTLEPTFASLSPSEPPTDQPSLTPSALPTDAACNLTLQAMNESVTMTLSGSNVDQVNSTYIVGTFLAASSQVIISGCAPTITSVTVQSQIIDGQRRRLQQQVSTLTVILRLGVIQAVAGDFFQPSFQNPFQNALSTLLDQDGHTLLETGSSSPTHSPSATPSLHPSIAPSLTPSSIPSSQPTQTPRTPTPPPTPCPTSPPTHSPSTVSSDSPSISLSEMPSSAPSQSPSIILSRNPSQGPSALASRHPSDIPSKSPSTIPSDSPSISLSQMPSSAPSQPPSFILSRNPSHAPSALPSRFPSDGPSKTPSSIPSELPSSSPSGMPSFAPSQSPSFIPSKNPSEGPSALPSRFPSDGPSKTPSSVPSELPSSSPSGMPSFIPSKNPSHAPSAPPSRHLSDIPSTSPSLCPSVAPSFQPSEDPSISAEPSSAPSNSGMPSLLPSGTPSLQPSSRLSLSGMPSNSPSTSATPSLLLSTSPSQKPSTFPSVSPSSFQSNDPSDVPSQAPSIAPSDISSGLPSKSPSRNPSSTPSDFPIGTRSSPPSSSSHPSDLPSSTPSSPPSSSLQPSVIPSINPSSTPSDMPSARPSSTPSMVPSALPSPVPSASPSFHFFETRVELDAAISNGISTGDWTSSQHGPIETWDVSRITDFTDLFFGKSTFNEDISLWDVSSVTSLYWTFFGASNFNADIKDWDVSSVSTIRGTFAGASNFNADISGWDVSSVTTLLDTFGRADKFDVDLSGWNIAKVTSLEFTFYEAIKFNRNLCSWGNQITNTAIDVFDMFGTTACPNTANPNLLASPKGPFCYDCGVPSTQPSAIPSSQPSDLPSMNPTSTPSEIPSKAPSTMPSPVPSASPSFHFFETRGELDAAITAGDWTSSPYGPIETWDVSRITDFSSLFNGKSTFNEDIKDWDVSSVTSLRWTFNGASNFNADIKNWDVSKVSDLGGTFYGASNFNADIKGWDVSKVTTLASTFSEASNFDADISGWDVSNVSNLGYTFLSASNFNADISGWDVSKVADTTGTFGQATIFNRNLCSWGTKIPITDSFLVFGMYSSTACPNTADPNLLASPKGPFCYDCGVPSTQPSAIPSSQPSDLPSMNPTSTPSEIPSKAPSTMPSPVPSASPSFQFFETKGELDTAITAGDWTSSPYGPIATWDVSRITDFTELFKDKTTFNEDISLWDVSSVTTLYWTFDGASMFNADIKDWDVSSVSTIRGTFLGASNFNADISGWDVSSVTTLLDTFGRADKFDVDLSGWNIAKVTSLEFTFYGAIKFDRNLCSWGNQITNTAAMRVLETFTGATACPNTASPNLSASPKGPFCYDC